MKKTKQDRLAPEELANQQQPYYEFGKPYTWVMGFGWCIIGFYVRHENPLLIRVAHANHFKNAKVDYGRIMTEGPPTGCEWRYEGSVLLLLHAIQRVGEYHGEVPRGPIHQ